MPAGIWVKLNDGREFDSTKLGITYIESFAVPAGQSGSKAYPEYLNVPLVATSLITNSIVRQSAGNLTPFDRAQSGTLSVYVRVTDGIPTVHWDRLPTINGWAHESLATIYVFSGVNP